MVHVVRLKGGRASYCNRWVDTARLRQEEAAGWALGAKSESSGARCSLNAGGRRASRGLFAAVCMPPQTSDPPPFKRTSLSHLPLQSETSAAWPLWRTCLSAGWPDASAC